MFTKRAFVRLFIAGLTLSTLALGGCTDNNSATPSSPSKISVTNPNVERQRISCTTESSGIPNIFSDCVSAKSNAASSDNVSSYKDDWTERLASDEEGKLPVLDSVLQVPVRVESQITRPYITEVVDKDTPDEDSSNDSQDSQVANDKNGTQSAKKMIVFDCDTKGVLLKGGTRYSLTFDDIDHCGLSCLDFHPTVHIVSQDDYNAGNLNNGLDMEIISSDPQNRYVSLSFVAPKDGVYCVTVSDTVSEPAQEPVAEAFCYSIYPDAEKVGSGVVFTDNNNGKEIAYTNEEIQDMRGVMLPYVEEWEDGFPSKLTDKKINGKTWQEALEETKQDIILGHSSDQDMSSSQDNTAAQTAMNNTGNGAFTVLEPIVNKQAWDPATMELGQGFQAVSGLPARKMNAIEPFTLPTERKAFTSDTYMRLIENSTQQEKAMGVSVSGTFSGGPATISSSVSVNDVYKYSSNSTTLQIFYENCDTEPTKLPNASYKLTEAAKAALRENPQGFREKYGDYFIAGQYRGAKYIGNIAIRSNSTENLNTVKQKLSALISGQKIDQEFTKELKNVVKDCDIALSVHTEGGSDVGGDTTKYYDAAKGTWTSDSPTFSSGSAQNALSIDALLQGYQNFKKNVETGSDPKLTRVYAYLLEFSQIPDCESLSDEIPVDPEIFIKMRQICRNFLQMTANANEYVGLPVDDFCDGRNHLQGVRAECDDLSTRFKTALRSAASAPDSFIATWTKTISDAKQKMDDRLDRYYFVHRLSEANSKIGTGDLQPNRSVLFGYSQYLYSKTCNADFVGVSSDGVHKSWKIGRHHWNPRMTCNTTPAGVAAGIEWKNQSNRDCCKFTYYPPLTRKEVGLNCEGGYDRDVNWDLKVYWINSDNYKDLILPSARK